MIYGARRRLQRHVRMQERLGQVILAVLVLTLADAGLKRAVVVLIADLELHGNIRASNDRAHQVPSLLLGILSKRSGSLNVGQDS
jgi:hypothetical protein